VIIAAATCPHSIPLYIARSESLFEMPGEQILLYCSALDDRCATGLTKGDLHRLMQELSLRMDTQIAAQIICKKKCVILTACRGLFNRVLYLRR